MSVSVFESYYNTQFFFCCCCSTCIKMLYGAQILTYRAALIHSSPNWLYHSSVAVIAIVVPSPSSCCLLWHIVCAGVRRPHINLSNNFVCCASRRIDRATKKEVEEDRKNEPNRRKRRRRRRRRRGREKEGKRERKRTVGCENVDFIISQ